MNRRNETKAKHASRPQTSTSMNVVESRYPALEQGSKSKSKDIQTGMTHLCRVYEAVSLDCFGDPPFLASFIAQSTASAMPGRMALGGYSGIVLVS
jgi:hypothetical protein